MAEIKKVGFVGLGIMGKPMAKNLQKAGFELHIWARHPEEVTDLVEGGMTWHESLADLAASIDAQITIVGFPPDVEQVYLGKGGIVESAAPGTYVIDMTTSSPTLAQKIEAEATARGLRALDAPVTGGDTGAQAGTLSIMVGGAEEDFEACLPLFRAMGTSISYMGGPGFGQHTKMANQIMIAGAMAGVCEGLSYAKAKGIELQKIFDAVKEGSAAGTQLSGYAPRIIKDDWAPGFKIEHFVKDLRIARSEAEGAHLDLDMMRQVLLNYENLILRGMGANGTQALIKFYESGD